MDDFDMDFFGDSGMEQNTSSKRRSRKKRNVNPLVLILSAALVIAIGIIVFLLTNIRGGEDRAFGGLLSNIADKDRMVAAAMTAEQMAEENGCPAEELIGDRLVGAWHFKNGKYCSDDGVLVASPGEAALILNGEAKTGDAVMRVEAWDDDMFFLEVEDFHARDCIVLAVNSKFPLEAGDVRSLSDFIREKKKAFSLIVASHPLGFAISQEGRQSWGYQSSDFDYCMPVYEKTSYTFHHLTVRILEWDNAGNVAVYFTTEAVLDGSKYELEGLVVADMDNAIIEPGVGLLRDNGGSGGGGNDDEPFKPTYDCIKCGGDGDVQCSNCDGKGGKYKTDNSTPNYSGSTSGSKTAQTWESCFKCSGTGETTCPSCGGSGKR